MIPSASSRVGLVGWFVAILACLPAFAATTSLSFSMTGNIGSTQTSPTSLIYQGTGSGTATPYGTATGILEGSLSGTSLSNVTATGTLTLTFGSGDSIQFLYKRLSVTLGNNSGAMGPAKVSGGTGMFEQATGSINFSFSGVKSGPHASTFTLAASGTITTTGASRVTTVTPNSLTFSFLKYSVLASEPLVINNANLSPQTFFATVNGGSWLSVEPSNGTVQAFSSASLIVTADPTGVSPGTYYGTVTVTPAEGGGFFIPVAMTISASPFGIVVSQNGMRFEVEAGAGVPPSQGVAVVTQGVSGNWTASATSTGWLSVTPTSGMADVNSVGGTTISVDPSGLKPGDYYGFVDFSAQASSTPQPTTATQSVVVVLTVTAVNTPPAASVFPTGTTFVGQQNGPLPSPQMVAIANPTVNPMSVTANIVYLDGGGWLSVNPPSAAVSPSQAVQFTLSVDQAGLTAGQYGASEYKATLEFQFGDGSIQSVEILLIVEINPIDTSMPRAHAVGGCTPSQLFPVPTMLGNSFNVTAAFPVPIEVLVVDDCGAPLKSGAVGLSFSSGDPGLSLSPLGDGRWTGTWQPRSMTAQQEVITFVAENANPFLTGTTQISGVVQPNQTAPTVSAGGVVNAASYAVNAPLAPGDLISIFGQNLATRKMLASAVPLPNTLNGTKVRLGGEKVPLFFVSDGQIDALVPYDVPPNTTLQLIVLQNGSLSLPEMVTIAPAAPAALSADGSGKGLGLIFVVKPNGTQFQAAPNHPASAGDTLVIYAEGLGAVNPTVHSGAPAPTTPPSQTTNEVAVTIGGVAAKVEFSGLTPGLVGVYQVNVAVPAGITPGPNVPIVITEAGQSSLPVTIPIQ